MSEIIKKIDKRETQKPNPKKKKKNPQKKKKKKRELLELKHVGVECRSLKIWGFLSFLICSYKTLEKIMISL